MSNIPMRLANIIAAYRTFLPARLAAGLAGWYLQAYHNSFNTNMTTNGEKYVLKRIEPFLRDQDFSILDVGANVGNWSFTAAGLFSNSKIYAFEMIDEFIEVLNERATGTTIQPVPYGLSDENTELTVFARGGGGQMIAHPEHPKVSKPKTAQFRVGDEVIQSFNVRNVQIVKIDVEGHEMNVLNGLKNTINTHRPIFIQFEYSSCYILHKRFLKEVYDFFVSSGYVLGRLFPKGVLYRDYRFYEENFLYGNFIATPKDRSDVVLSLSC